MPSITFTAATMYDMEQQIRNFLNKPVTGAPQTQRPRPSVDRPVPDWAPAGAYWQSVLGAPLLLDPAGAQIPVSWATGEPMPGVVIVNHDADAEAAGAALLAATQGSNGP